MNEQILDPTPAPPEQAALPVGDTVTVRRFRKPSAPRAWEKLNADLDLHLDEQAFSWMQTYFASTARRDPIVGEVRLLEALWRDALRRPDRFAVGELVTDREEIAETWAEMMADRDESAPLTLAHALDLVNHRLALSGHPYPITHADADGRTTVLSDPMDVAHAVATGYAVVSRPLLPHGDSITVCRRSGAMAAHVRPRKRRAGELLVLLRNVNLEQMTDYLATVRLTNSAWLSEVRAVRGASLVETVCDICDGATLYADRIALSDAVGRANMEALCHAPASNDPDRADFLLRISPEHIQNVTQTMTARGLYPVFVGQTHTHSSITLMASVTAAGERVIADLAVDVIRAAVAPRMDTYRAMQADTQISSDENTAGISCAIIRANRDPLRAATAYVTVRQGEDPFRTATDAVRAAITSLTDKGFCTERILLAVSITAGASEEQSRPTDATAATVCGIYRAATDARVWVDNPTFRFDPRVEPDTVRLAVTAWTHDDTNTQNQEATMNTIFESLSKTPRTVLLDTDMGPDCDDAGALALLIHYAKTYGFTIGGIANCTSNRSGTGVVDAVCRYCGLETPPLGQWSGEGFMDDSACHKYTDAVAERFSEAYRNGTLHTEDSTVHYRRLLANAPDGGVMMISIGMFNNLAALLRSPADDISPLSGEELIRRKVYALVSMAAILPAGRECNVICDYPAAETVLTGWPTPIYLSDFHIGFEMFTGYAHITDPAEIEKSPLTLSYHLYTRDWPRVGDNSSYDLTAVQFAAEGVDAGDGAFYDLGEPGRLEFYAAPENPNVPDATRFIPDPEGNLRFMIRKVDKPTVAAAINPILHQWC